MENKAEDIMGLEQLDGVTRKFIEGLMAKKGPPLYTLSPAEARKVLDDVQSGPVKNLPVRMEDKILPCGPDKKVSIRIIRPETSVGKLPVIMFYHGGGWVLGNMHTHDRLVRELAIGANAAVVFVNFTSSPEAQFPKPLEEAFAATQYINEHGGQFNLDPHRIAVAGDSVGGNMAIAVTLLAKEKKLKLLKQVLFYPVTDANFDNGSYKLFAAGPWLTKAAMEWFWNAYAPNLADRKKPTVCPLHASPEQLRDLPPALVITDENDVLRDEGEAYAHKLMQSGVPVTAVRFLGTCHDFAMLNALSETPAARGAITLAIAHLYKALHF
jgi:acetyl esterase